MQKSGKSITTGKRACAKTVWPRIQNDRWEGRKEEKKKGRQGRKGERKKGKKFMEKGSEQGRTVKESD